MSLFGDTAQAVMILKADVSDLRAKLRTVAADEKAVVQASIAAAEARNKSIEKWTAGLAKVNVAMALASKAVSFAADAWKVYDEQLVLAAGSASFNLDRLRKASLGMKTDTELMRLGVAASTTTFKLSQQQLENVLKAQIAWEDQGKDSKLVQEALESAITKGSIRPLKELGINLEMATGKGAAFAQVMEVIAGKAKESAGHQIDANDEFKRAGVEWQNAMTKLKSAIGAMVIELAPLLKSLSSVVTLVAKLVSAIPPELLTVIIAAGAGAYLGSKGAKGGGLGKVGKSLPFIATGIELGSAAGDAFGDRFQAGVGTAAQEAATRVQGQAFDAKQAGWDAKNADADQRLLEGDIREIERATARALKMLAVFVPPKKGGGGGKGGGARSPIAFIEIENTGEVVPIWGSGGELGATLSGGGGGGPTDAMFGRAQSRFDEAASFDAEKFAKVMEELNEFTASGMFGQGQSFLAGIFGPIDEFNAYSTAFEALTGTLQTGFDAWVSGSASAGDAMKAFAKSAAAGAASQMFGQALLHGAHAIGQFAFGLAGGPAGAKHMAAAAVHAKAALAFGAGAALLGTAARGMSSPAAAGAATGSGRAPTVGGRTGDSGGGNQSITVVVGETFGDDSPRQRSARVASAIRRARRELDDNKGVSSS